MRMKLGLGAALAGVCAAGLAAAAPEYEPDKLDSIKTPGQVRSCLATTLSSRSRAVETPNLVDGKAASWTIAFLHERRQARVTVQPTPTGTRVVFDRRLGIDSAPVADLVRACV